MSEPLQNMMRGLTLHFLHQGTVDQAVEQGREAGVPVELLECLPGMMFEITSAACAVAAEERTLDDVAEEVTERALASDNTEDFGRDDAVKLLEMTGAFIQELCTDGGDEKPLPRMAQPWYQYEIDRSTSQSA